MYVLAIYTSVQSYLLYQSNIIYLFLDLTRSNLGLYLVNTIAAPTSRATINIKTNSCISPQRFDKYKMYHPDLQQFSASVLQVFLLHLGYSKL